MFLIHCVIHNGLSASMTATSRRTVRSVRAISVIPISKRRRAVYVLGSRNIHARVLDEEAVGFEEDVDVLHGHTAKPAVSMTFVNVNQILTLASLLGAGCASCLRSFKMSCAMRTEWVATRTNSEVEHDVLVVDASLSFFDPSANRILRLLTSLGNILSTRPHPSTPGSLNILHNPERLVRKRSTTSNP